MITVNELFAGIGSQRAALERLGIEHKVVGIAEIDRFATLSYAAIYNGLNNKIKDYDFPSGIEMVDYLKEKNIGFDFKQNKPFSWERMVNKRTGKANKKLKQHYLASALSNNYGDIGKIDKLDYADFWTYSFPCQDISVAGKQAGIKHGKTRSGLLYEVERLLEVAQEHDELPKYLMLENVKNLVGKKFKPQFEEWLQKLDELGYNSYYQVLNAKNYGVPQNRERVFAISIRKDIDMGYVFPEPFELKTRLKDILEKEVDEKFYISQEKTEKLISQIKLNNPSIKREPGKADGVYTNQSLSFTRPPLKDLSRTLKANVHDAAVVMPIDKSYNNPKPIEIANCITAREDRGISNHKSEGTAVLIPQATKQGYIECNVPGVADLSFPDSKTRRGRVQENGNICPTLMAGQQDICYMEPVIAASRGRNPNNPSDRTVGSPTEQRLEINKNGTSNTITTVQKDNYVVEPRAVKLQNSNMKGRRIKDPGEPMFTVTAHDRNAVTLGEQTNNFRIRKLTPKECWRLMGFADEQFYRAAYGHDIPVEYVEKLHNRTLTKKEYRAYHRLTRKQEVSNSQLYKQAGNSIVVDVLYYIFRNLFIEKPKHRVCVDNTEQLQGQMNLLDYL